MMLPEDRLYLAALQMIRGIGYKRLTYLLTKIPDVKKIWQSTAVELKKYDIHESCISILQKGRNPEFLSRLPALLEKFNTTLITIYDETYPPLLKETATPPYILYCQGKLPPAHHLFISIVGSRKSSPYGNRVAHQLGKELAQQDVIIVSGGARGIDTKAHQGALQGNGKTIVVIASGIDITYPPENTTLFANIIKNDGCILSEYPFGTPPSATNFPARNRIIAGLSSGVIIVEAAAKSGALITTDFALEEGRDIFVVPGSIYSLTCQGSNALLRNGAIALTKTEDVIIEYKKIITPTIPNSQPVATTTLTPEETQILAILSYEVPLSYEDILLKSGLSLTKLPQILLQLQLKQCIKIWNGSQYIRI